MANKKVGPVQHAVPKELLVHMGDITVSFAMLEFHIQMLTGSLINEHQRIGQIVTAELSFRALRGLVTSLYRERHGEDADFGTLVDLMKRAQALEEIRNQITHSIWLAGDPANTIMRFKTTAREKPGLKFSFEKMGELEFANVASDLQLLTGEILEFTMKLIRSGKAINNPSQKTWGSREEKE